jgi:hypothetical protein
MSRIHDYRHGGEIGIAENLGTCNNDCSGYGWFYASVEEMRDLRYLLDRAIAAADEAKNKQF